MLNYHPLNPSRVLIIEIVLTYYSTGNGIQQLDDGLLMEFTSQSITSSRSQQFLFVVSSFYS